MRCARSWFNPTLYKKNLTRFWPAWGLYLVIWLLWFLSGLVLSGWGDHVTRFATRDVLRCIYQGGLVAALLYSLLAAAAVWSYLFNNRSTCMMHTLPIRREGLFLTNFLSGLTFLAGPNLVVFLLAWMIEISVGCVHLGELVLWFFGITLIELFFFCLATFCAMCTGHILGLPALYAVFNALAAGVLLMIEVTLERFVFGYYSMDGLIRLAEWLTPMWKLGEAVRLVRVSEAGVEPEVWQFVGLGYILIYVVLGLLLAGAALLLYRRRDMERAGDLIAVPWMRPVFQYGVAFCCALVFGNVLYELFRYALPATAWTLLFFMLLCGVVGYFAARMLLEKSFRVFGAWKGCLPFAAVLIVLMCVMELDLVGFENRVPEAHEVVGVEVEIDSTQPYDEASRIETYTEDAQVVQAVLAAHRCFVENKQSIEYAMEHEDGERSGMCVYYTLTNGKRIVRDYSYEIPVYGQDLDVSETPTAHLDRLVNLPQLVRQAYGLDDQRAEDLLRISVDSWQVGPETHESAEVNPQAQARLLQAIQADLAEGNLVRYLVDNSEQQNNCLVNDLRLTFYREGPEREEWYGDIMDTVVPVPAEKYYYEKYGEEVYTETITVGLQTTARHTLAVLQEPGVLDCPIHLATWEQQNELERLLMQNDYDWQDVNLAEYTWEILGK